MNLTKIHHRERQIPNDDDMSRLLYRVEDTIALLLLVDCGLRIHELATIKLKSINLDDCRLPFLKSLPKKGKNTLQLATRCITIRVSQYEEVT